MNTAMVHNERRGGPAAGAFTLLELIVVIGIMVLIGSLVAPSLKKMKSVDQLAAANRQLLADLGRARQLAIAHRAPVYVLFMPVVDPSTPLTPFLTPADRTTILANQLTAYAMFTRRSAGDQPGREYPRYLGDWQSLPEGVFIPPYKFNNRGAITNRATEMNMLHAFDLPIPSTNGVDNVLVPYVAFDDNGSLISARQDEIIPLARGLVTPARDGSGNLTWQWPETIEEPPGNSISNFNYIRIDWLTGRARVERPEIVP